MSARVWLGSPHMTLKRCWTFCSRDVLAREQGVLETQESCIISPEILKWDEQRAVHWIQAVWWKIKTILKGQSLITSSVMNVLLVWQIWRLSRQLKGSGAEAWFWTSSSGFIRLRTVCYPGWLVRQWHQPDSLNPNTLRVCRWNYHHQQYGLILCDHHF